jgi:uncharacterized protein YndB with AHSA1/START domain
MSAVRWPAGHEPTGAVIHEVNCGHSHASPDRVWAWLTRPDQWGVFYNNASSVRSISGDWPQIGLGSRFSWVTFNVRVITEVIEYEPYERLAWTGAGHGSRGHHAWLLTPDASGTIIQTEETQRGLLSRLSSPFLRPRMRREHQNWVDQLALIAVGPKPST